MTFEMHRTTRLMGQLATALFRGCRTIPDRDHNQLRWISIRWNATPVAQVSALPGGMFATFPRCGTQKTSGKNINRS
eukprot:2770531-Karenia_brevis.AAC.1